MKNNRIVLLIFAGITGLVALVQIFAYREIPAAVWQRESFCLPGAAIVIFPEKSQYSQISATSVEDDIAAGDEPLADTAELVPRQKDAKSTADWKSVLQIQYLPQKNFYLTSSDKSVNGVAVGYYLPQKEVNGVSVAMLHMFNNKKGFSMSLIDAFGNTNGFSLFLAGRSLSNDGCSMGLWNVTENNNGLQIGLFNQAEKNIVMDYPLKPENSKENFGVQAGIVNYSDARGIQFGLWNTNPNSLIKHFPFINICF